ncbi:hypothetical protein HNY73_009712 [Argiope bruennichi]|uniref:Uncharacterized protein n=1 Tax=Argiope bruennichi TaxID=94029 RepID=A0A8T0FBB0_ARGBR|nr:hypothetical protein HNY73_009712 [Argiope bruennichi]
MARYLCQICHKVLTYDENHPCLFYKNDDNVYSMPRTGNSDENNEAKDKVVQKIRMTILIIEVKYPRLNENKKSGCSDERSAKKANASFTASLEKFESVHRRENVHREAYEETTVAAGLNGVEIQKQSGSCVSDLMHATTNEEYKMSLEKNKCKTLHKDKRDFIDFLECVIRAAHSDSNNFSGTENLILNPDLPPGSKEPKNGESQVSQCVNHKNSSPEMHSQGHNKKKKIASDMKEPISIKENDNAVAGPSGPCLVREIFLRSSVGMIHLKLIIEHAIARSP